MSRRKRQNQSKDACKSGFFSETYWGSYDYNRRLYFAFRSQIIDLALTRYQWLGLPETVNPAALERTLLYKGMATIARHGGIWYGLPLATVGKPNMYQEPTKWYAMSNTDAGRFLATPANGVVVYDSPTVMLIAYHLVGSWYMFGLPTVANGKPYQMPPLRAIVAMPL